MGVWICPSFLDDELSQQNPTMAPPPQQKGKFRPRKPPKPITAGASTGSGTQSSGTGGGGGKASSGAKGKGGSGGRGGGRGGRGGRSGGRGGGRGGRGRGRQAMPRGGAVFFTGSDPSSASSNKKSAAASRGILRGAKRVGAGADGKPRPKGSILQQSRLANKDAEEVIVGELDEAIGASQGKSSKILDGPAFSGPSMFDDDDANKTASSSHFSIAETYDSDSSVEERRVAKQRRGRRPHTLQPTQLPFPVTQAPLGIGEATQRLPLYPDSGLLQTVSVEAPVSSPFADTSVAANKKSEQDSWFLFQFPTRLPLEPAPIAPSSGALDPMMTISSSSLPVAPPVGSDDAIPMQGVDNHDGTGSAVAFASEVSTPPVVANSFDNALTQRAGKLGKIRVYKSGKTVLDMGNVRAMRCLFCARGSLFDKQHTDSHTCRAQKFSLLPTQVQLDISEGLSCGFHQQAVLINPLEASYVELGEVRKTVVVTPQVENAFAKHTGQAV